MESHHRDAARFAGIRTPSELFTLRWSDVDFDAGKITIHSPKTEHYAGGGSRIVPLFVELRGFLETLFRERRRKVMSLSSRSTAWAR